MAYNELKSILIELSLIGIRNHTDLDASTLCDPETCSKRPLPTTTMFCLLLFQRLSSCSIDLPEVHIILFTVAAPSRNMGAVTGTKKV